MKSSDVKNTVLVGSDALNDVVLDLENRSKARKFCPCTGGSDLTDDARKAKRLLENLKKDLVTQ